MAFVADEKQPALTPTQAVRYTLPAMGTGFDHYKRLLAFAKDTWNEHKGHPMVFYAPRRKERVFSRTDKRAARREARAEMMRSL